MADGSRAWRLWTGRVWWPVVTGPVEWLERTLAEAEMTARRAQGTWTGQHDGWRINIVDEQGRKVAYLPNRLTAEDAGGDYATAAIIEPGDPAAVLRRVAGVRAVLAEHPPVDYGGKMALRCVTCKGGESIVFPIGSIETPQSWPCRTVRLLAEAWGWEEQA